MIKDKNVLRMRKTNLLSASRVSGGIPLSRALRHAARRSSIVFYSITMNSIDKVNMIIQKSDKNLSNKP